MEGKDGEMKSWRSGWVRQGKKEAVKQWDDSGWWSISKWEKRRDGERKTSTFLSALSSCPHHSFPSVSFFPRLSPHPSLSLSPPCSLLMLSSLNSSRIIIVPRFLLLLHLFTLTPSPMHLFPISLGPASLFPPLPHSPSLRLTPYPSSPPRLPSLFTPVISSPPCLPHLY